MTNTLEANCTCHALCGWHQDDVMTLSPENIYFCNVHAAAPEMLEALTWILFETGKRGANSNVKHRDRLIWETARAAITKAEGKGEK